jgi:hypothetical protein
MNQALNRFWQQHGLSALLSVAALCGAVAIGIETQWGGALRLPSTGSGADSSRAPEMVATYPNFSIPSLNGGFVETAERPLFLPSRRPIPAGPSASTLVMKKGQYKLSGTSVESDLAVAYLIETATNKSVRATKGKEIVGSPGLMLDQVEATRVVLKLGDDTETLELRTAASPSKPATPPGSNASPGTPAAPGVASVAPVPAPSQPPAFFAPQPAAAPAAAPAPANSGPTPGSSVMPGFVLPGGGAAAAAPAADAAAQRRRRFQNLPQQ